MANNDLTIDTQVDSTQEDVAAALEVIADNFNERNINDGIIRAIQDLFEESFIVREPKGPRKLSSQLLYQALWRTATRMKLLDFQVHGTGVPVTTEKVVTAGISTVMDRGGYDSAFRDKQGVAFNLLLYGDAFELAMANPDKKAAKDAPIVFSVASNDRIWTDNFATAMRANGTGRSARKVVISFTYSKAEFDELYPDFKDKVAPGMIRRNFNIKEQVKTIQQEIEQEDEVEVAWSFDLDTLTFVVFAGAGETIIKRFKTDDKSSDGDYPFVLNGDAYIPILQFICIPSSEGFFNHGIGSLLFRLSIITRRLMNMELGHIEDNVYPIELITVPQGEGAKFFGKMKKAHKMRIASKKAFAVFERDPNDPNGNEVTSRTLTTPNLFNEWAAVFDRLVNELRRLGINVDELDIGQQKTATEVLALEENSNSFVRQTMEYNASESQFAVELTMDMIKEFIPKSNKSKLNLTINIQKDEDEMRADFVTLGQVSDELKKNNYFVKINSKSGTIPSGVVLRAQISEMIPFAQPGSKAQVLLTRRLSELNDLDIPGEDFFAAPEPTSPPGGRIPEEAAKAVATRTTETDRLTINPRAKEQVPVI